MIRYRKYQSNKKGAFKGKWYARSVTDETYSLDTLAQHMANHSSPYSYGTIKGVLSDMVSCIRELVLDGKAVKIDDLAIFRASIQSRAADTAADFTATENIAAIRLRARATGTFRTAEITRAGSLKQLAEYTVSTSTSTATE